MEQPCYQCGANVEEGVPFCPHCNAPQIRVLSPEAAPPEVLTEAVHAPQAYVSSVPPVRDLRFPEAWWAAGLGVLAGAIPIIVLFELPPAVGMIVAGFLSVLFYRRRSTTRRFTVGVGARLGVLCGLLASGALALGVAVAATVFHQGDRIHQGVVDLMDHSFARMSSPPPPEVAALFKTPAGMALLGVIFVVATVAFSALGGVLGAALLSRKDKP